MTLLLDFQSAVDIACGCMNTHQNTPHLVSKQELAREILRVSPRLIDKKIADGSIPVIRVGRRILFDVEEVVETLKNAKK